LKMIMKKNWEKKIWIRNSIKRADDADGISRSGLAI
jgi:hypothetical protein